MEYVTKKKQRIICATPQDFERLRRIYFPHVPESEWKDKDKPLTLHIEKEKTP